MHASPYKPRPLTWRQVMTVLEDTHEALCHVLLILGIPRRAREELRAVVADRVRPILEREGRRLRAIPARARSGLPRKPPTRLRHLSPQQLSDYRLCKRKGFKAARSPRLNGSNPCPVTAWPMRLLLQRHPPQRARRSRGTLGSRFIGRSGFQPAMVRTHSRACVLSVMPGNSRRSSTAAANSPRCS